MTIIVDDFWWENLTKLLRKLKDPRLSEAGVLSLAGDTLVAARAAVESAKEWNENTGEQTPITGPTCKYCGGPVSDRGQVHVGGCGNVG